MKKAITIIVLSLLSSPAVAGQGFFCTGPDGLEISLPLAGGAGLHPLLAEIKAAGQTWTTVTGASGTTEIVPAQSFSIDDRYYFDFTTPNYEGVVASIRLFRGGEEAFGGTLAIKDVGAWPIVCDAG